MNKKVLHIITVSFVINHFFGHQFNFLKKKTGNKYYLGCSPSEEFFQLSNSLGYTPFSVNVTRNISPFVDLFAIFKIYLFIKKEKMDVVVGHTPKGGMVAMLAGYFAGVKERIYFRHGIIYETSRGFKRFLLENIDRLSGSIATKVVCVSHSVKQISESDNLNKSEKNIVLGLGTCNGIDTEKKFNPELYSNERIEQLKTELNIQKDQIIIGYVGRLVEDKGINELVEAFISLQKKRNNSKLLLVGPMEKRDSIKDSMKIEIENNTSIIHTDFVLDASPYYSIMDIFVLPSYREGFPTVTLEASSMEIPILTTTVTGCRESIIENETGMFIDNTSSSIVDKIEFYLDNEEMMLIHGKKGREFVQANFQQEKIWNIIHEQLGY